MKSHILQLGVAHGWSGVTWVVKWGADMGLGDGSRLYGMVSRSRM